MSISIEEHCRSEVSRLRQYFNTQITKSYTWRLTQLRQIIKFLDDNETKLCDCLYADMSKPKFESSLIEVVACRTEANHAIHSLSEWMQPERVPTPLNLVPAESFIVREPFGVVLNIVPFNYPLQLAIMPLISAITAGNVCAIKPSEMTPTTSQFIADTLLKYLDSKAFSIIQGGIPETTALLQQKFDYIFFTGSETVGRIVLKAAAANLTPVTLELGGKSPCIVASDADLSVAARRIVWGKCLNAGQTCIAPDYVMVHESIYSEFVEQAKKTLKDFYGNDPKLSSDFCRIVNTRHAQRLIDLIEKCKSDIIVGGNHSLEEKYIEPTIIKSLPNGPAMKDEIFGPIMPVIKYSDFDRDVVQYINSHSKPLAIYLFTSDKQLQKNLIDRTTSGGVALNDVMMHFANSELPFGGIGESGFGAYHGKSGFNTFSHAKPVLNKSVWLDSPQRYPPYTESNYKIFRFVSEIYRVNSASFNKLFKLVFWPTVAIILATTLGVTIGFRSRM